MFTISFLNTPPYPAARGVLWGHPGTTLYRYHIPRAPSSISHDYPHHLPAAAEQVAYVVRPFQGREYPLSQSERPGREITNGSAAATTVHEFAGRTNRRFDPVFEPNPLLGRISVRKVSIAFRRSSGHKGDGRSIGICPAPGLGLKKPQMDTDGKSRKRRDCPRNTRNKQPGGAGNLRSEARNTKQIRIDVNGAMDKR